MNGIYLSGVSVKINLKTFTYKSKELKFISKSEKVLIKLLSSLSVLFFFLR